MTKELNTEHKHLWEPLLSDIAELEDGWEDCAKAVPDAVIDTARILLEQSDDTGNPTPEIKPTLEGGILLEWKNKDGRLLVDIRDGSDIEITDTTAGKDKNRVYDVDNPDTVLGIINGWDFGQ